MNALQQRRQKLVAVVEDGDGAATIDRCIDQRRKRCREFQRGHGRHGRVGRNLRWPVAHGKKERAQHGHQSDDAKDK